MRAEDYDEILSFGTYSSSEKGAFKPHASLTAQANGSLSVKAAGLKLLPEGGASSVGSGDYTSRPPAPTCVMLLEEILECVLVACLPQFAAGCAVLGQSCLSLGLYSCAHTFL